MWYLRCSTHARLSGELSIIPAARYLLGLAQRDAHAHSCFFRLLRSPVLRELPASPLGIPIFPYPSPHCSLIIGITLRIIPYPQRAHGCGAYCVRLLLRCFQIRHLALRYIVPHLSFLDYATSRIPLLLLSRIKYFCCKYVRQRRHTRRFFCPFSLISLRPGAVSGLVGRCALDSQAEFRYM